MTVVVPDSTGALEGDGVLRVVDRALYSDKQQLKISAATASSTVRLFTHLQKALCYSHNLSFSRSADNRAKRESTELMRMCESTRQLEC